MSALLVTFRLLILLALLPCLAACASPSRKAEFDAFASGRYAEARAGYEAHLLEPDAETTLDRNLAGTAALMQGDVEAAHRHFREAFDDLEDLTATTAESAAAIVGPDRSKRWKGDPHERVMNAYYLGVTYWLKGDVDNAAASFKSGLLRDADSEKGEAQSDFALLWFLLGMAQKDARHSDGGSFALKRAQELVAALDAAKAASANVVIVMDAGMGPRKTPEGEHGSQVRYRPRNYAVRKGVVTSDGAVVGDTVKAVDVYEQAVTRGHKTMDDVNLGKAVVKDAAIVTGAVLLDGSRSNHTNAVGAALLAAGLLLPAEADVRSWDTVPGEVHVLAATLPPGKHVIRVEPRDAAGHPVAGTAREFDVSVPADRVTFLWCRAAPRAETRDRLESAPKGGRP